MGAQELIYPNVTDYIILAVVAVSILISLVRGFVKELISLVIWILGFWVAIKFYHALATVFEHYIANSAIRHITSFTVIFLAVLILGALFNYLLSFIIIKTGLSGTDRLLGMIFGFARGVLLVAMLLLLISSTSFIEDAWWKQSILIPHFHGLLAWLKSFLPEKMANISWHH